MTRATFFLLSNNCSLCISPQNTWLSLKGRFGAHSEWLLNSRPDLADNAFEIFNLSSKRFLCVDRDGQPVVSTTATAPVRLVRHDLAVSIRNFETDAPLTFDGEFIFRTFDTAIDPSTGRADCAEVAAFRQSLKKTPSYSCDLLEPGADGTSVLPEPVAARVLARLTQRDVVLHRQILQARGQGASDEDIDAFVAFEKIKNAEFVNRIVEKRKKDLEKKFKKYLQQLKRRKADGTTEVQEDGIVNGEAIREWKGSSDVAPDEKELRKVEKEALKREAKAEKEARKAVKAEKKVLQEAAKTFFGPLLKRAAKTEISCSDISSCDISTCDVAASLLSSGTIAAVEPSAFEAPVGVLAGSSGDSSAVQTVVSIGDVRITVPVGCSISMKICADGTVHLTVPSASAPA